MINSYNKYTQLQLQSYNNEASKWSETNRDPVVGSYDAHNAWEEYENLFKRDFFKNPSMNSSYIGLDFATGPGRNIVKYQFAWHNETGKYHNRFKRLDGVDISPINIEKCKEHLKNYIDPQNELFPLLFVSNGVDIDVIPSSSYDFVMSTIALQHICVYDIRYNILKDIYRVLKEGGMITAQMGFGGGRIGARNYYDNFYDAGGTNGGCDVRVDDASQIKKDLLKIGFKDFEYIIGKTGPGDHHEKWIYFSALK